MTHKNKGFTLVEILIVVIILGILAAIVIPQFTNASDDARKSALASDLQSLRSQIELYKIQHHDRGPNIDENGDEENDADNFVDRLTGTTDEWGDMTKSGKGPYMQEFPANPFADTDVQRTVTFDDPDGDGSVAGWYYDTATDTIEPTATGDEDE
ncbi:MAG: type II secretion system protein [Phycisphaerae bacterium]